MPRTKKPKPEYLTVKECQAICRFKGPEPIRRAIYRGDLPATRLRHNWLLIKSKDFWKWFHSNEVRIKEITEVDLFEPKELKKETPK